MVKNNKENNQKGFTLIELALSTIIVGVLFAAIAYPYSIWLEKRKLEQTSQNVEQMAWAISAFRSANGHYPCPAPMDAPRDSNGYGYQTNCSTTTVALESCSADGDRYCRTDNARTTSPFPLDLNYDGTITLPAENISPTVRIGTIPFRELNMPEEYAYDAYGNRILYAVTENMAFDNNVNHPQAGGINIVYTDDYDTNSRSSRLDTIGSANFVVLSHGPDKIGGYNIHGTLSAQACNSATADGENCNLDSTFYISETVDTDNDNKHDDVAVFQLPLNAPLWARSSANTADIYSIKSENNPTGQVGSDYLFNYYTDPTHPTYSADAYDKTRMWVGGNIQIEPLGAGTGQAQAFQICDRDGKNCFEPKIIGGEGIKCAGTTSAMLGVIQGDVDCAGASITYECPINPDSGLRQIIKSIDDGKIICTDMPCRSKTVSSCSQSFLLPETESGRTYTVEAGDEWKCSKGNFTCEDGEWSGEFDGMCTCTDSVVFHTASCPDRCTGGIITLQTTTDCERCNTYRSTADWGCICPEEPEDECTGCECDDSCDEPEEECTLTPACLCDDSCDEDDDEDDIPDPEGPGDTCAPGGFGAGCP